MSDMQRHSAKPYLLADHPDAGFNQRMTDLQAALGNTQMDRAEEIIFERQRLAQRYDQAFADLNGYRYRSSRMVMSTVIRAIHVFSSLKPPGLRLRGPRIFLRLKPSMRRVMAGWNNSNNKVLALGQRPMRFTCYRFQTKIWVEARRFP